MEYFSVANLFGGLLVLKAIDTFLLCYVFLPHWPVWSSDCVVFSITNHDLDRPITEYVHLNKPIEAQFYKLWSSSSNHKTPKKKLFPLGKKWKYPQKRAP